MSKEILYLNPVIRVSIKSEAGKLVIVDMNNSANNYKSDGKIKWREITKVLRKILFQS